MRNNGCQNVPCRSISSTCTHSVTTFSIILPRVSNRFLVSFFTGWLFFALNFSSPLIPFSHAETFQNVDLALPALVQEGESLRENQHWYRAHSDPKSFISSFSADGHFLALTSTNNPVELWDTKKQRLTAIFAGSGPSESTAFVTLSPDSRFIAINVGERIEIRHTNNKQLVFSVPSVAVSTGAFSHDNHWFATTIDGKRLDLWDIKTKKRNVSLSQHKHTVTSLDFSADGQLLVSADQSGIFYIWDVNSGAMLTQVNKHKAPISTVRFSDQSDKFVTIDTSGAINLWDAKSRQLVHRLDAPKTTTLKHSSAVFSPDGKTIAVNLNTVNGKNMLYLFSALIGGKPLLTFENNDNEVSNIAFRPDGNALLVSLNSKTIKVFDVQSQRYVDTFGGQILKANKTAISPDGKLIATGTVDGRIQLWDAQRKVLKYSLKGRNRSIEHILFSPDGSYIIVGDNRGTVTIWERITNNRVFFINAHQSGSAMAVMSPDNQFLATASSTSSIVKLWDVQTNSPTAKFLGHHGDITDLAYSPDGRFIASSSEDGTVKLWNTRNKSLAQTFHGNKKDIGFLSLAFSADGRYLAAGSDEENEGLSSIEIWDIKDNKYSRTLTSHTSAITTLHFSADGKQLVSASRDGIIKVWGVRSGEELHSIATNQKKKPIKSVDFTKDGKSIISVNSNGSTELWDLKAQTKTYTLVDGPRGMWVSEDHIKKKFYRGDDGSLNIKTSADLPPAPLAPKGLANEDKLLLTASRKRVTVAKNGGKFTITIKNIGTKPSYWLRARQLHGDDASVTLLSDKLTKLNAGQRGILSLKLIPHNFDKLATNKQLNLEMEIVTKAGSHFPIVIPLEFQNEAQHGRNN